MRVPGQVFENLFGSSPWRLGVHDPLGLGAGGELELELAWVCQGGELRVEREPSLVEGAAKQSQELTPEHAAEHAHRQEESGPAGNPARAIESQPTSRHDAMHMRMVLEVLAPGVEDRQDSDLGPEMLGIDGDLLQRFGGGSEQKAVNLPLILKRDRTERRGKRENHMKVLDGLELGFPGFRPLRRGGGPALGAVAVAA